MSDLGQRPRRASPRLLYRERWVAIGWLLVGGVVYLSLTPEPPDVEVAGADKLGHFFAYLMLMIWFCALYAGWPRVAHAVGLITLGVALEILQGMTAYRYPEVLDVVANTLGVACGWGLGLGPASGFLAGVERWLARVWARP